jgi:hypothetical protein
VLTLCITGSEPTTGCIAAQVGLSPTPLPLWYSGALGEGLPLSLYVPLHASDAMYCGQVGLALAARARGMGTTTERDQDKAQAIVMLKKAEVRAVVFWHSYSLLVHDGCFARAFRGG